MKLFTCPTNFVLYISMLLSAPGTMCLETRMCYRRRCRGGKPLETLPYLIKDRRLCDCKIPCPLWYSTQRQEGKKFYINLSRVLWVILLNHVKSLTLSHCPWSSHFSTRINLSFVLLTKAAHGTKPARFFFSNCYPLTSTLFSSMCEKHTANIANEMYSANAFMDFSNEWTLKMHNRGDSKILNLAYY